MATICTLFGGYHLLGFYGDYIEAGPLVIGEPLRIRGSFIQLKSPDEGYYELIFEGIGGTHGTVERRMYPTAEWLLGYRIDEQYEWPFD